jgi:RimJ/RimL family protein N-acetyltransferase
MIETKNLFIRRFRENDLHDLQRMLANPAVMVYSGLSPFTVDRSREWLLGHIARYSDASPPGVFAIETKDCGEVIGYCGLEALPENIAKAIEVTVGLEPSHWGKGYAMEAVSTMIEYAFTGCRFEHVVAVVHAENQAARRLVMKCGFRQKRELAIEGVGPHILFAVEAPTPSLQQTQNPRR